MKLLIATHNPGKLHDYLQFTKGLPIEIVSLKDLGITEEFEEPYATMEENAKGKAEFYGKLTGLPTLSDDSGIEISYYNMEPGPNTKHWAGENVNEEDYFEFILEKIRAIPENQRQAQFRAVQAYFDGSKIHTSESIILGELTDIPHQSSTPGFPWKRLFKLPGINKYYQGLSAEEHVKNNHRKLALDKLIPIILHHGI